jgi:hypothetical protein
VLFARKVDMKSVLHKFLAATIAIAPIAGLPILGGCSSHYDVAVHHDDGIDGYAYEPGYYYDAEYYDPAGHFHGRRYYYYDGHAWADRDGVPAGFTAHDRHDAHYRHALHEEHEVR